MSLRIIPPLEIRLCVQISTLCLCKQQSKHLVSLRKTLTRDIVSLRETTMLSYVAAVFW
jgi:hypothetical protein